VENYFSELSALQSFGEPIKREGSYKTAKMVFPEKKMVSDFNFFMHLTTSLSMPIAAQG